MPAAAKGSDHLFQKGNTYYFRIAVPQALRETLGRSELRYSLTTGYIGAARLKAKRLALAAHDLFTSLKSQESGDMIDVHGIKKAVDDYFRHLLAQNERHKMFGIRNYPGLLNYIPGETEKAAAMIRGLLAHQHYTHLDGYVTTLSQDVGAEEPTDPAERRVWAHEIGKHLANLFEIVSRRAMGDYTYELSIYPPKPSGPVSDPPAPPAPAPTPEPVVKPVLLISEALARYRTALKEDKELLETSITDIMSTLDHLTAILGDVAMSAIDHDVMRTFKTTLRKLPSHRTKRKEYRDKTVQELVAMDVPHKLSKTTRNNILTNVSSFFGWCVDRGYLERDYAKGLKERIKEREDEARAIYSREELATIFNAPEYRDDAFKNPSMFWTPLLLAYTGARREEICQLHVADIRQEDGTWVLDINDNPNSRGEKDKRVKTPTARRLIPLHPVLVELGFLDFHRSVDERGEERLFPELRKIKEKYGHSVGNWFGRFRHRLGLDSESHDLHSFRHTFIDHLKQKFVPEYVYVEVTGHKMKGTDSGEKQSTAGRRYAKRFPPSVLLEQVILQIDYGLDHSHLKGSKFGTGLRAE